MLGIQSAPIRSNGVLKAILQANSYVASRWTSTRPHAKRFVSMPNLDLAQLQARLIPRPKRFRSRPNSGTVYLDLKAAKSSAPAEDPRVAAALERFDKRSPGPDGGASTGQLHLNLEQIHEAGDSASEAYGMEIDTSQVRIRADSPTGFVRALTTLRQICSLCGESEPLPGLSIQDWADYSARGLMLDVSRDRVPTMESMFELIEQMLLLKLNVLQLYFEHSFAYSFGSEVWKHSDPFTADEIRALDKACKERCIELIPNQQSFGHMHRWLKHSVFSHLAECPEGIDHPFADKPEPFGLNPTDPQSIRFLSKLYDELLPNFSSRQFNVGLDEAIDLGLGRSKEICEERGNERVYLDFLKQVHALTEQRGVRMQFWADWILRNTGLCAELPRRAVALAWGYEADHPFATELEVLKPYVEEVWVCPGTSSWNSFAGRPQNASSNLSRAAGCGLDAGAAGYMITDWGDNGHLQPPITRAPGLLLGAALAWNSDDAPLDFEAWGQALDDHLFAGQPGKRSFGRALLQLGFAAESTPAAPLQVKTLNGNAPYFLLHFAAEGLPHPRLEGLVADDLHSIIESSRRALDGVTPEVKNPLSNQHGELELAHDFLRAGCRLGLARLQAAPGTALEQLPLAIRKDLADELTALISRHRALWTQSSRPGGLNDSCDHIQRVLTPLTP